MKTLTFFITLFFLVSCSAPTSPMYSVESRQRIEDLEDQLAIIEQTIVRHEEMISQLADINLELIMIIESMEKQIEAQQKWIDKHKL